MKKPQVRIFDFPVDTGLPAAVEIIEAALADEGLHLMPAMQGFRPVYSIRYSGSADEPGYLRCVVAKRYILEGAAR